MTENETSTLTKEIEELEKEKATLEKQLLEAQREELEWEKKVKLATEMKKRIAEEQSEKGDIGSMKNEIHRMEVIVKPATDDSQEGHETHL